MSDRSSTAAGLLAAVSLALATVGGGLPADTAATEPANVSGGDAGRGAYLATIMVCGDCHSGRLADGRIDPAAYMAGGAAGFEIPGLGIFYPPNLTSDPTTGLGRWSDAEIATAVREGVRPDGRLLAPIMPAEFYRALTDADVADLVAYLRSLPPVVHAVPAPVGMEQAAPAPYYAVIVPASAP